MRYVVLFDASRQQYQWWFPAIGFALLVAGAIALLILKKVHTHRFVRRSATLVIFFAACWTSYVWFSTYREYTNCVAAINQHRYLTVEGQVEDFHPMPKSGHSDECFRVRQETFCYSDYAITPGFNQTSTHGGPIRPGLPLRIAYLDGYIIRLEVRTKAWSEPLN